MINILVSLLLIAAVKSVFLWIFVPKTQRQRHVLSAVYKPADGVLVRDIHDERGVESSLCFASKLSEPLIARKYVSRSHRASALGPMESR